MSLDHEVTIFEAAILTSPWEWFLFIFERCRIIFMIIVEISIAEAPEAFETDSVQQDVCIRYALRSYYGGF